MDYTIELEVRENRLHLAEPYKPVIAGNTNYKIHFKFDETWQKCRSKTAVFVVHGNRMPVEFTEDECEIPIMPNDAIFLVSLIASTTEGEVYTTAPLRIVIQKNPAYESLNKEDPYKGYYAKLLGFIEDIGKGEIYTKNSDHSTESDHALSADTAQTAENAKTSDYASEASHASSADTAKFSENSSHAEEAESAKAANRSETSGYADEAGHAQSADTADEAAHSAKADSATEAEHSVKADTADEAAHSAKADSATEAEHSVKADTADKATHSETSDSTIEAVHAESADTSIEADHAKTAANADRAETAENSNHAASAIEADHAEIATNSGHADSADIAYRAEMATSADHATSADSADHAESATGAETADYATKAGNAETADYATKAGNAETADYATRAKSTDSVSYAEESGSSRTQVSKTGDEDISGIKNFKDKPKYNGEDLVTIKAVSNPNLLINGDFKINQRAKTSYSTVGKYTVDRWKLEKGSLSVEEDGIVLNGTISQTFATAPTGTLTASVDSSHGEVTCSYSYGVFKITAANVKVSWAKLEVGSFATMFSPKPAGQELADCKYFFQTFYINNWFIKGDNTVMMDMYGFSSMRVTPSLVVSEFTSAGKNNIRGGGKYVDSSSWSITSARIGYLKDNQLQVLLDTTGISLTLGYVGWMEIWKSFTLDAEIY